MTKLLQGGRTNCKVVGTVYWPFLWATDSQCGVMVTVLVQEQGDPNIDSYSVISVSHSLSIYPMSHGCCEDKRGATYHASHPEFLGGRAGYKMQ